MSDRLTEIRARLDAATPWIDGTYDSRIRTEGAHRDYADWLGTAPADIAWLLDEVERLQRPRQHGDGCAAVEAALCMQEAPCNCGLDGNDA